MKRMFIVLLALGFACAAPTAVLAKNPTVTIKTNKGTIKIELLEDKAPITVKNFLKYVDDKHYDNTIFHRVISKFMIQGGGFTKAFTDAKTEADVKKAEKKTGKGIKNEAKTSKLSNKRGTIAMARTNDPDSATAQFFINVADNSENLDPNDDNPAGYAVFGKVTSGMDVVDKIKAVKTRTLPVSIKIQGREFFPFKDVPADSVVIESIRKDK